MKDVEEILGDLIALRSDGQEKQKSGCADYICQMLQSQDVLCEKIFVPESGTTSVVAGINVTELKNIDRGLVLSGHMDTVGINEAEWKTNPFEMKNIDGRFYGRGTVDMKYFIAVVLSLLGELKKVSYPVLLLFSGDEEREMAGIRKIIEFMSVNNIHPKAALVGEPTNFAVCTAHNGYYGFRTRVIGKSGHSSRPDLGCNAIYVAAKIISKIEALNAVYSLKGTTISVGIIQGGKERNSIAGEAYFDWDIRCAKEEHYLEILRELELFKNELYQQYKQFMVEVEQEEEVLAFEGDKNGEMACNLSSLFATNIISLGFATEAGFLQKYGVETVIYGAGEMAQMHADDESIKVVDLAKYKAGLAKFVEEFFV